MSIKQLREALSNLPDDGEVYIQRIEDFYFEENLWTTRPMEGEVYHSMLQWNKDIDSGKLPR